MSDSRQSVDRLRASRTSILLALAASTAITGIVRAADREFTNPGVNGKWENPATWFNDASNGPPPPNDANVFLYIANNPTPTVTFDGDTMTYYQTRDPNADPGHYLPVGAALNIGSMNVSNDINAPGILNFSLNSVGAGGTLSIDQLFVGGWGAAAGTGNGGGIGTLNMSGGQINIVGTASNANTGTFTLGNSNNTTNLGYGTMIMSGGTLNMGEGTMIVGFTRGYGTFSQSGGVVSVAADRPLVLGGAGTGSPPSGGNGYYALSGTGMLTAGSINYGRGLGDFFSSGSNTFSMQGGTLSVGSIGIAYTSTDNYVETFSFTGGTATIGTMELALTQQGGTLSPGAGGTVNGGTSAAVMHLLDNSQYGTNGGKGTARPNAGQANYVQSAGAHLLIDIAGPGTAAASDPETNYDRVQVEDNAATSSGGTPTFATLNGEIDLRVPTSTATYNPSTSDAFYVVTADAITDNSTLALTHDSPGYIFSKSTVSATVSTGIFSSNNPIPLPTTTSGQAILVSFVGHARPGDDTRDQTIDSSDFAILAAHYGQVTSANYTIGWGDGDFNGDGTVNALDFNALATNFGKGGTVESPIGADLPDAAAALGSVVPEPLSASILLAAMGVGLMGRNRRRTI